LILPARLLMSAQMTEPASTDADGNVHFRAETVVSAGGTQRFDWPCKARRSGSATLTVKALTDEESDAVQLPVPVLPSSQAREEARTGSFSLDGEEAQSFRVTLPGNIDPGATALDLHITSGAGVMLEALPFLI